MKLLLLLPLCLIVGACETIPVNAQACYTQNGMRICSGYSTTAGISLDAAFAAQKK